MMIAFRWWIYAACIVLSFSMYAGRANALNAPITGCTCAGIHSNNEFNAVGCATPGLETTFVAGCLNHSGAPFGLGDVCSYSYFSVTGAYPTCGTTMTATEGVSGTYCNVPNSHLDSGACVCDTGFGDNGSNACVPTCAHYPSGSYGTSSAPVFYDLGTATKTVAGETIPANTPWVACIGGNVNILTLTGLFSYQSSGIKNYVAQGYYEQQGYPSSGCTTCSSGVNPTPLSGVPTNTCATGSTYQGATLGCVNTATGMQVAAGSPTVSGTGAVGVSGTVTTTTLNNADGTTTTIVSDSSTGTTTRTTTPNPVGNTPGDTYCRQNPAAAGCGASNKIDETGTPTDAPSLTTALNAAADARETALGTATGSGSKDTTMGLTSGLPSHDCPNLTMFTGSLAQFTINTSAFCTPLEAIVSWIWALTTFFGCAYLIYDAFMKRG